MLLNFHNLHLYHLRYALSYPFSKRLLPGALELLMNYIYLVLYPKLIATEVYNLQLGMLSCAACTIFATRWDCEINNPISAFSDSFYPWITTSLRKTYFVCYRSLQQRLHKSLHNGAPKRQWRLFGLKDTEAAGRTKAKWKAQHNSASFGVIT